MDASPADYPIAELMELWREDVRKLVANDWREPMRDPPTHIHYGIPERRFKFQARVMCVLVRWGWTLREIGSVWGYGRYRVSRIIREV